VLCVDIRDSLTGFSLSAYFSVNEVLKKEIAMIHAFSQVCSHLFLFAMGRSGLTGFIADSHTRSVGGSEGQEIVMPRLSSLESQVGYSFLDVNHSDLP